MEKHKAGLIIGIVVGVLTISTSAILVRLCQSDSGVIAFYRMFFSVLLMLPVFLIKFRRDLKNIVQRDWLLIILAGFFLAFHFILWFESLRYTSVASSTVLVTLQPLFAFIGTYFIFKERFSSTIIFSGMLAVIGSVLISWGDFQISGLALLGDVLALIACGLATGYFLFGQSIRQRLSIIPYTFVVYLACTLILAIYVVVDGESFQPVVRKDWIYFILLAIFPTLLGHSIFNWAVKWISTSTISMVILFEPVGASILAYYFFQEKIRTTQFIGGLLVLLGIGLFTLKSRKVTNEMNHIEVK